MKREKGILLKLFISMISLGTFTFGGGYVIVTLMKKKFADEYHWIDEKEMLEKIEAEQPKKAPVKPAEPVKPQITIDDFAKIEMKVGQVLSCEKHPKADKLLVSQIDIGEEKPRQIVSGIAGSYKPEQMIGKKVVVITNLASAKLRGVESQGMILAGMGEDQIEVLSVEKLPVGSTVR